MPSNGHPYSDSVTKFLAVRLKLRVNLSKSAVDRPWNRKFLGYSMTRHMKPRLMIAPQSVKRLKDRFREEFRAGRGRSLTFLVSTLTPKLQGSVHYFKLAEVRGVFEELDGFGANFAISFSDSGNARTRE